MRPRVTIRRVAALERHRAAERACVHGLAFVLDEKAERAALAPCPRCGRPKAGLLVRVLHIGGGWAGAPRAGGG
jgi:hypothetical protein